MTRLVRQYRDSRRLYKHHRAPVHGFARKFTAEDLALLAETDRVHGTPSGPPTKRLVQRAFEVFGDVRYVRLATILVSHLYNLRAAVGYRVRRVS